MTLPLSDCLLTWGGETILFRTDMPELVSALRREAGPFFCDGPVAERAAAALHLTLRRGGEGEVGPYDRVRPEVDPIRGVADVVLEGPYSIDEKVLTTLVYASVLLRFHLLQHHDHVLHLHAAVLVHEGKGYALVGPSGAGKTTITARWVRAGGRYLSDEDALMADGRVFPLPRALRTSVWGMRRLGLEGKTQSYQGFFNDHGERWDVSSHYETTPLPLGGIVLLQPRSVEKARCMSVGRWDLWTRLIEEMHREYLDPANTSEIAQEVKRYNRQLFDTLERILNQVPLVGIEYDLERDLDDLPALLTQWMDS